MSGLKKIEHTKLIGKWIAFLDKNQAFRVNKVIKIVGNRLTVENGIGQRIRIHPTTTKIIGMLINGKGKDFIPIEFGELKKGKNINRLKRIRDANNIQAAALKNKRRRK